MITAAVRRAMALGVVAVVVVVAGCAPNWGQHEVTEVAALRLQVDEVGYSRLDDPGVEQIVESRIVKFDLRQGTIPLSAVGLVGRQLGPAIGGAGEPEMVLVLDGPAGREVTETRTMMFGVDDPFGELYEITYWRSADTADEAVAEVRAGIKRWGFSPDRIDEWERGLREFIAGRSPFPDDEDKTVVSYGVSPTGLISSVEVKYKPNKPVVLRYMVHIERGMYDPRNLDSIRKIGDRDPNYLDYNAP